jgi:DNA-binding response OmpR family regulator
MTLVILFVEKDISSADLLVPGLERKGYQTHLARTQRQAVNRIRSLRPDLLIVDVASFGASGVRLNESLRSRLDGVPAILLVEERGTVAVEPGDAVMTPPFTSRKLLHRVKTVAAGVIDYQSRELRGGPLVLDPLTRILRKRDASLKLRPKEAALLAFFMQNPGKVLSRPEIMKQVWETEYTGDTRTISVHVRWLRQRIEDDPDHPRFLRTVRGVGYRFEVPEDLAST